MALKQNQFISVIFQKPIESKKRLTSNKKRKWRVIVYLFRIVGNLSKNWDFQLKFVIMKTILLFVIILK